MTRNKQSYIYLNLVLHHFNLAKVHIRLNDANAHKRSMDVLSSHREVIRQQKFCKNKLTYIFTLKTMSSVLMNIGVFFSSIKQN